MQANSRMERLPVAEPLRGSDFRGKAAWNDGLGETALQQTSAVQLVLSNSCERDLVQSHQFNAWRGNDFGDHLDIAWWQVHDASVE